MYLHPAIHPLSLLYVNSAQIEDTTMADTLSRRNPANRIRTISSNEAKQHWGAMMKAASEGEAVIVESHGKPKAVVISPEEFRRDHDCLRLAVRFHDYGFALAGGLHDRSPVLLGFIGRYRANPVGGVAAG